MQYGVFAISDVNLHFVHLFILLDGDVLNSTRNVVFPNVFQYLL